MDDLLKSSSLKLAKLHGFGGKVAAMVITLSCALVFLLKYSANPVIQLVSLAGVFVLILLLLIMLFIYSVQHPEKVMMEGAEYVQLEQLRMGSGMQLSAGENTVIPGRVPTRMSGGQGN